MLGGVILAILSVSIISAKGLEWCLYTKYSIRPDTTIHGSRPMTSIPDDVRIDFYFAHYWIESFILRPKMMTKKCTVRKYKKQAGFYVVALELKICKSEFPDRENRGYNDYDSLASSKPSNFIENTGTIRRSNTLSPNRKWPCSWNVRHLQWPWSTLRLKINVRKRCNVICNQNASCWEFKCRRDSWSARWNLSQFYT